MLGSIHACVERAAVLITKLRAECDSMPRAAFTFLCPIWRKPWMWCGGDTYVSSLVEAAGGRNLLRECVRYPAIDLAEALATNPDVVFLPDEPYAFTISDAEELKAHAPAEVIGPFPGHLFTWHGTRTILGLRFLKNAIATHPR